MKLVIVSVHDSAADCFNRPVFVPSVGAGVRSFSDEVNREAPDNLAFQHPGDFSLYVLGTFDDADGSFDIAKPHCVARGKELRLKGE